MESRRSFLWSPLALTLPRLLQCACPSSRLSREWALSRRPPRVPLGGFFSRRLPPLLDLAQERRAVEAQRLGQLRDVARARAGAALPRLHGRQAHAEQLPQLGLGPALRL